MLIKPISCLFLLFCCAHAAIAQDQPITAESRLSRFVETGKADSERATLHVYIREADTAEPILGATVLLQRQHPDQVHGKVTQWDGRCKFKVAPSDYHLRVQLTGMVTFEMAHIELLAGRQYELEVEMARLGQPVPSAKQQAGNN